MREKGEGERERQKGVYVCTRKYVREKGEGERERETERSLCVYEKQSIVVRVCVCVNEQLWRGG